jgi:uncharacterized phage protein (TIGR02218 family)
VKTIPSGLAAVYASGALTIAEALRITRADGQVYAFTSHDVDVTIGGVVYQSAQGLAASSIEHSAAFNVDNLELTTIDDGTVFTQFDIQSGIWRKAAFVLFRYNWASPIDGIDTLMVGHIGEVYLRGSTVVVEMRGLQQFLQQQVGDVSSKTCRARLGDSRCTKDLTGFTVSGTITHVTDRRVIRDSARTEAVDYFGEGLITLTSGANAGLSQKVRVYAANGTFTLALPFLQDVAVGTTYTAVAGCRKRVDEDCKTKFDNVLNFVGEPHRPLINELTQTAEPAV